MHVQLAASAAVRSAATTKPVDVVAIQPSTGRVLAVVERPGGFDRALQGEFPPGSTFKVVTASALAQTGMRPASTAQCPSQVNIGGRAFHNFDFEQFGTTTLQNAFAVSCNTTFAMLATQRLGGSALASMAASFGFNAKPALGIPAELGQFSTPSQPVDLAADAFGQGTDLVNPLSQATEAAAIEDGTWRPPQLVTSPAPQQASQPLAISPRDPWHAAPDDAGGGHQWYRRRGRVPARGLRQDGDGRVRNRRQPAVTRVVHRLPRGPGLRGAGRGRRHRSRCLGADRQRLPAQPVTAGPGRLVSRLVRPPGQPPGQAAWSGRAHGPQPDGDVQLAEAAEHVVGVLGADVREDVAEIIARAEQLALDVGAVLGE